MATKQTSQNIRFGVEIEVLIPTDYADIFVPGGYHNGNPLTGEGLTGWNVQRDGSIQSEDGFIGVEVVSGVLSGEDGLIQVVAVMDQLKAMGCKCNDSTGLHVHIDGRQFPESKIDALIANYKRYEKLLYGVNGGKAASRWLSTYCKPSTFWADGGYQVDRYRGLNLKNYYQYEVKKSIEFRMFAGTLDAEKVVGILYILAGLVVRTLNEGLFTENAGTTAVAQFHAYGEIFRGQQYRMVKDAPIWDVLLPLGKAVKRANI